jgi:FKBP-type peptidyl-prolyl cis-trans isomerase
MWLLLVAILATGACQKSNKDGDNPKTKPPLTHGSGAGSGGPRAMGLQVPAPADLTPPADATKTASGLAYKKLTTTQGPAPGRNDLVLINYTGWRPTGETFFTTRSRGQPLPLNLAKSAPGFTEALQLLHKGEKALLWMPGSIGYKTPQQGAAAETRIYEVELVDVMPSPAIPADLAAPATALTTKLGTKYVVLKPGTGEKVRNFDTATFHHTSWDEKGTMLDSTETQHRPNTQPVFKQSKVLEDILVLMAPTQRIRFWADASSLGGARAAAAAPKGVVTFEVELVSVIKGTAPPPTPPDVAAPPPGVQKTPKGVSYRVLAAGKGGAKPKPTESVRVHYTGWTTDGRMFDSSVVKNEPTEFRLDGVIAGWTEGIPLMSVGDKYRFWIPDELAYKGAPGRPQGMLVFDIELLEIKATPTPPKAKPDIPAPPDVKAPPADAKKTPSGLAYKALVPAKTGPKPTLQTRVKVDYTGWTTDGKMFDSSVKKGKPLETGLEQVIAGWTEGLQLMSVGDKFRFWIPEELAYKGRRGKPAGMLVFDVEMLEILK